MPTAELVRTHSTELHSDSEAICTHKRRGPVTMGSIWVTMVASFPAVLIGFEWHKQGFSLQQTLGSLFISIVIMLAYSIPIVTISTRSGLSFKYLCKKLFGQQFSKQMTVTLAVLYLGWYAVMSLCMADATCGVFGGRQYFPLIAFLFCFAMAFNNFFGFTGVANFARFVCAPIVICWVAYVFTRMAPTIPHQLAVSHSNTAFPLAFCAISQFIIGYAIWGNEADYWRHGQTRPIANTIAVGFAQLVGVFLFPLTGYLIAAQTGITDSGQATAYINSFSFGKAAILGLIFLAAQYFAANDSNLYAFIHASESFTRLSHKKVVTVMALLAGIVSAALALTGLQSALESICALNSVLLPSATVLIAAEWFIFRRHKNSEPLPSTRAASIAWAIGVAVGILTSGFIPGLKGLSFGVPALQAWLVTLLVYLPLRKRETSSLSLTVSILHPEVSGIQDCA